MRTSDQLFQLIKSLSQTEKRYFRLQSQATGSRDAKYLQLFDLLDKQKEYEESKVLKKLGGNKKKLATDKNYLFEQILRSLRPYYSEQGVESKARGMLQDLYLLYDKGLMEQAEKRYRKAIKLVSHYELLPTWLDLYNWEWEVITGSATVKDRRKEKQRINAAMLKITAKQRELVFIRAIYDELFLLLQKHYYKSKFSKEVQSEANTIFSTLSDTTFDTLATFKSKYYYLLSHVWYYRILNQRGKSLQYYEQIIAHWEAYPHMTELKAKGYYASLHNYLDQCLSVGHLENFERYMSKLNSIPRGSMKFEAQRFSDYVRLKFLYLKGLGKLDACVKLCPKVEEGLTLYKNLITVDKATGFRFHMLDVYIITGQLENALRQAAMVAEMKVNERLDVIQSAGIIRVLLCYIMGDLQNAAYFLGILKRHYSKEKLQNELERKSLGYLTDLLKLGKMQLKESKQLMSIWFDDLVEMRRMELDGKATYKGLQATYLLVGQKVKGGTHRDLALAYLEELHRAART